MTPTTPEALKAARERISDPERWTQGEYAKNTQGEACNANSSEACQWCAAGAVLAEVGVDLPNERAAEQLSLPATTCCKVRGCPHPVVGSSTTGEGHVCKGHNEAEWGRALRTYDPELSVGLLRDSERHLTTEAAA